MKITSFFSNLSIAKKLNGILGLLVVGFLVIGIVYAVVVGIQSDVTKDIDSANAAGLQVSNIQTGILNARRFEKDFLLFKELELLENFEVSMSAAMMGLDELKESLASSDTQLVDVASIVAGEYSSNFYQIAEDEVAIGLDVNSGYRQASESAAIAMELSLLNYDDSLLTQAFLSMRIKDKGFLQFESADLVSQVNAELDVFDALLEGSTVVPEDQKAAIGDLAIRYGQAFNDLANGVKTRSENYQVLQETVSRLDPAFGELRRQIDVSREDTYNAGQIKQALLGTLFAVVLLAVGLISAIGLTVLVRSIQRPIANLSDTVGRVAAGDLDARTNMASGDELGQLGSAFDMMLEDKVSAMAKAEIENRKLNEGVIKLLRAVADLSKRDLTIKVPVAEDVTGPIADALNLLTRETADVLSGVTRISVNVAASAKSVQAQSKSVIDLSRNEQKEIIATMTDLAKSAKTIQGISELAQSSNEFADITMQTTQLALTTVTSTIVGIDKIRETIRETEKRIKRLGERSQEISGAVNLINNIAERTHILALNASMHAASAGEAGRGFAVVANEVQRLAENAREATAQISTLVNNIQVETSDTVVTMNEAIAQVVEGSKLAQAAGEQMEKNKQVTTQLVGSVQEIAENSVIVANNSQVLSDRAKQIREITVRTGEQLMLQGEQTENLVKYAAGLLKAVRVFKLEDSIEEHDHKPVGDAEVLREASAA